MSQSGQVGGMTVTDGVIPSTALTSGTTLKTINGSSIVGSGDLTVSGAGDFLADGTVPMTGDLEFAQNQALQFVFENRTSDPGSPVVGQCWFRTDL